MKQDRLWRAAASLSFGEAWERSHESPLLKLHFLFFTSFYLLHDSKLIFFMVEFAASILALSVSDYFYSVLLLDVVLRDADLQNVFKAITSHGRSILVTAFFGIIVIYFFAIVGMLVLNTDPSKPAFTLEAVEGSDGDYCNK